MYDGSSKPGVIFNIQKFSLHDGSGIRTLVFLKGCPLACRWCSNPEGQSASPDLAYNADKCIGAAECGKCREACSSSAIQLGRNAKVRIDRSLCNNCGECVEDCPSKALELFGRPMSVEDVLAIVEEDCGFYARSGGGVTLSGGEPLCQPDFARDLLKAAQSRGIDTALETSGLCKWADLRRVCGHANQVFYDIKSVDPEAHEDATGVGNQLILENLRRLCESFPELPITVRTPVVPGFNDSPAEVKAIVDFLEGLPGSHPHELLAYHGFGEPKYRLLDREYPLRGLRPPPQPQMTRLREIA